MNKTIPASKYCSSIFDGTHATPLPSNTGFPLITSKNISGGYIDLSDTYLISTEDYHSINTRSKVSQWDVLFSMIGTVGEVYLEKNLNIEYAIKNIGVFSCANESKAKWLFYYLKSPVAKTHINRYLNGAVQKFLSLGALREFPILEYNEQSAKSVELLSSIDAKIELNRRINAELEEMAKTLYDYWFVQFEFPNAKDEPYKTSGGKMECCPTLMREIPTNWKVDKIGNLFQTSLGGTPSTSNKDYWENGTIKWLNSGEIANFPIIDSELKITESAIGNSATQLLPKGSVVLSITRHLRPSVLAIDACANQSVVGIREKGEFRYYYLYPYLKNEIPRLNAMRSGAQQPHINKDIVDESYIVIPNESTNILKKYNEKVAPLYELIMKNSFESKTLTELRDWLLPMLMNGQVKIS
ncbi:restriction endonuclease subunit S [Methylotenera sp.]|uniref:restriction endonuclease subunit S n=1 Tax=Methylotenera sp. TaxID=2051956 RepID=UPI002489DDD8|nr:restriction endonuclease subunit S [Methylotenera sp.]MDI1363150.1 restriction endonuclease subunit S [Methylotenera sp.]